ncbi:MAG: hypothetical protein VX278_08755, partial [Myxococcota bacterium]|nr:hypothetical protein [Myxococcota bacterium]
MSKRKKRRFFRREPQIYLMDERVSTISLPAPPVNIPLEEDEEDVIYGEEVDEFFEAEENKAPLRVFLGSDIQEIQEKNASNLEHIWDFADDFDEEELDLFDEDVIVNEPPSLRIGVASIAIGSAPVEEDEDEFDLDSYTGNEVTETDDVSNSFRPGLATLDTAFLPEELFDEPVEETEVDIPSPTAVEDSIESVDSLDSENLTKEDFVLSDDDWTFLESPTPSDRPGLATLNTASLPIEEDYVVLDGELDFSKLDLNKTLKELADRDNEDEGIGDEITENDIMMPAFSIEPKLDADITIVPKESEPSPIMENKNSESHIEDDLSYSSMDREDSILKPFLIVLGVTAFFLLLILGIDYFM